MGLRGIELLGDLVPSGIEAGLTESQSGTERGGTLRFGGARGCIIQRKLEIEGQVVVFSYAVNRLNSGAAVMAKHGTKCSFPKAIG